MSGKIMKTLIWYRSILRDKIVEKLDNLGCSAIAKYQIDYMKKVYFEKNIRGGKGDIPFYSYSTKKMNKMGYKFKLSSLSALKKTIKNISKKTLF